MAWRTQDINTKMCLTCQHFKINRRLVSVGRCFFIEYDSVKGACKLFNNFPKLYNEKVMGLSFCHYRRWVDLPDND